MVILLITVDFITVTVPGALKAIPEVKIGFELIWAQHIKYVVLLPRVLDTSYTTNT